MPNSVLLNRKTSREVSLFQTDVSDQDGETTSSTEEELLEPINLNYLIKASQVLDSSPISLEQVSLSSEEEKTRHIFTPSSVESSKMDTESLTMLILDEISTWQKKIDLKRENIEGKESKLGKVNSYLLKLKEALSREGFPKLYDVVIKFTTKCSDFIVDAFLSQEERSALTRLTDDLVELCFRTKNPEVNEKSSDAEEETRHIFTPSSVESSKMDTESLTTLVLDEISVWQKTLL